MPIILIPALEKFTHVKHETKHVLPHVLELFVCLLACHYTLYIHAQKADKLSHCTAWGVNHLDGINACDTRADLQVGIKSIS